MTRTANPAELKIDRKFARDEGPSLPASRFLEQARQADGPRPSKQKSEIASLRQMHPPPIVEAPAVRRRPLWVRITALKTIPGTPWPIQPGHRPLVDTLNSTIVRTADYCIRHAWWVIFFGMTLGALSAGYAAKHFAITTDINQLISHDVPWTQRQAAFESEFPQWGIMAVIEAPTPELTSQATTKLMEALSTRADVIRAVRRPGGGSFFERNGLLFQSSQQLGRMTEGLTEAAPILETVAADPSLRAEL